MNLRFRNTLPWVPLVYGIVFFLALILWKEAILSALASGGDVYHLILCAHAVMGFIIVAIFVWLTLDIARNESLTVSMRIVWIAGIWLFGIIIGPIYATYHFGKRSVTPRHLPQPDP
jgi:hypothetical protein